jgi:(R,R)-butanediol dehydrogenase / meso-butanediol dehydrogenase / diacetyl reductase
VKAVSIKDKGEIQIEELPIPEPGPGALLLKVLYCSICGSEVERLYGAHWDTLDEGTLDTYLRGSILGHEYVGQVAALGEGVTGFSVGDRTVDVWSCCGKCYYCIRGMGNLCMWGRVRGHPYDGTGAPLPGANRSGAMAEYVIRPAAFRLKVPDSVSAEEAAMCEPLATGVTAATAAGISLGDSAAVIGVGHIGLMVLAAAKAAGAAPLIAVDKNDARLEVARQVGADLTLNPKDTNVVEAVVDVTEAGADVVFPCVSFRVPGILEEAFEMVRRRGRVILIGAPAEAALPTGTWQVKEVRIEGALHMGQEMVPALKLLQYKRANVEPCITEIIPLTEAQRAFDSLHDQTNIAVLLKP